MKERLTAVIKYTGLKPAAFARAIGVGQPAIAMILGGHRENISVGLVEKITEVYPVISVEWLLFGRGEMLKDGGAGSWAPVVPNPGTLEQRIERLEAVVFAKK